MPGRKKLTDDERKLYDDMHSRADLTDDESDDGEADDSDDDDTEALVIRGPGVKALLKKLIGDDNESGESGESGESADDADKKKGPLKDKKPPTRSKYFG